MNAREILSSPGCMRAVLTFLHFLWQGLAIALLATGAAKVFGARSPRIRYAVHVAALGAMVVAVVVTYTVVQPPAARYAPQPTTTDASSPGTTAAELDVDLEAAMPIEAAATLTTEQESAPAARLSLGWLQVTPYALGAYLAGVVMMMARLLIGLHGGGRLRRRSRPVDDLAILRALARQARALGLSMTPAIAYCSRVVVPTVVGVLRPVILLPFSFATGLGQEQVEALLAHELAHVRRLDPLVNVVQRVVEAFLFFHPAVWFVSHRIRVEREHCCDDLAISTGASASAYASSLVETARRGLAAGTRLRPVPQGLSVAGRPSQLRARVQRLLGHRGHERLQVKSTWATGLLTVAVVGLVAFALLAGSFAGEGAGSPGESKADEQRAEETAAARQRLIEKLNKHIPQVDFANAPFKEVLDFLSREMDVNIVIDPEALSSLRPDDDDVTLEVKDVPFRDVLKYLLWQKGLKFVIEDHALVVVPLDDEARGDGAAEAAAEDADAAAARQRILKKLDTVIRQVDFDDAELKEVLRFLSKEMGINIVFDPKVLDLLEDPFTSTTITIKLKDVPLKDVLKYVLKYKGLEYVVEDNAVVIVPVEQQPAEESEIEGFETKVFHLSVCGVRTIIAPDGERRKETIADWLRHTEGVTWPRGSTLVYNRLEETLTVTNIPENLAAIGEKVDEWNRGAADVDPPESRVIIETVPVDAPDVPTEAPAGGVGEQSETVPDDESGIVFTVEIMRLDAAAYATVKETVLGKRDDWRESSLVLDAEAATGLISALEADPSYRQTYRVMVGPTASGQTYRTSVSDPDTEGGVWYELVFSASVLPDGKGFELVLHPAMAEGEFGCLFYIDREALAPSGSGDEGHQAVYHLEHGATVLLEGVEKREDGLIDVAFMHVRVFDMDALREAQEALED